MNNVFTADNTEWAMDDHGNKHLYYTGDINDLSDETGEPVYKLLKMLSDYEEESKDMIDTQREIDEAKKGQY